MKELLNVLKWIGFYVWQWTWGILMNVFGLLAILVIAIFCGRCPHFFFPYIYIYCPWCKNCAFEAGMFFVMGDGCDSCAPHEMGHGLQNLIFGPLMPFVVSIPSAVRFWYREVVYRHHPERELPPYDSVWFEGTATEWGEKYFGARWHEHMNTRKSNI